MRFRARRLVAGFVALCAAAVATARLALPEEPAVPEMKPVKKIDHPFVEHVLGTWSWTSTSPTMGDGRGTITYRLGLHDSAVFEDVDGTTGGLAFQGHTVWRVSDDGTQLSTWWFETMSSPPKTFQGSLTADGYDLREPGGQRMTFRKTAAGLELKAYRDGQPTMTVTLRRG